VLEGIQVARAIGTLRADGGHKRRTRPLPALWWALLQGGLAFGGSAYHRLNSSLTVTRQLRFVNPICSHRIDCTSRTSSSTAQCDASGGKL
jgi:hypothetical protein